MPEAILASRLTRVRLRWSMVLAGALIAGYLVGGTHVSALSIGRSDFTSFYGAATLLREGHGAGIYNPSLQQSIHAALVAPDPIGNLPFVDPPVAAALVIPVTFLPLDVAYHVWAMLEFAILALAAMLAAGSGPWPTWASRKWKYAAVLAAMAGAGTYTVVLQAQWTPVVALGIAIAYRQWRSGRLASGAFVLVAGAGCTKPHLALVLVAFMLGWSDRRLLRGALAGAVVALLANLLVAGPDGLTGFLNMALTSQSQWPLATYSSFISIPGVLLGNSTATLIVAGIGALIACAVGWRLGGAVRRDRVRLEPALAAAAILSLLAAPHALLHDTTMLVPAVVWMLAAGLPRRLPGVASRRSVAAIATGWGAITLVGLASLVVDATIPLGWAVAAVLSAVAVPASLVALGALRAAPSTVMRPALVAPAGIEPAHKV